MLAILLLLYGAKTEWEAYLLVYLLVFIFSLSSICPIHKNTTNEQQMFSSQGLKVRHGYVNIKY